MFATQPFEEFSQNKDSLHFIYLLFYTCLFIIILNHCNSYVVSQRHF